MNAAQLTRRAFEVKAADGGQEGRGHFSGYASTWDQDLYGDVIVKGAFADTLAEDFGGTGAGIPIHFEHAYGSPFDIVGVSTEAHEDEKGLWLEGDIDLTTPEGQRTYDLMKRGLIHQMSIGFVAGETSWVTPDGKSAWEGYREIRSLKLFEVSVVQIAANQGAEVSEVKSAPELLSGRVLSKSNEDKIAQARDLLSEVLASSGGADEGEEPEDGQDRQDAQEDDEKSQKGAQRDREIAGIAEYLGGATH